MGKEKNSTKTKRTTDYRKITDRENKKSYGIMRKVSLQGRL